MEKRRQQRRRDSAEGASSQSGRQAGRRSARRWLAEETAPAFGSLPAAVVLLNKGNCAKEQAPPQTR